MASTVSVYVADKHPVFREGLTRAISEHPGFRLEGRQPTTAWHSRKSVR